MPLVSPRARKLTLEQASVIRAVGYTKSHRSLAADFGVSHETIRAVIRQVRSRSGERHGMARDCLRRGEPQRSRDGYCLSAGEPGRAGSSETKIGRKLDW